MTQQEINNIKDSVRIEEVIGRYVTLTRRGQSLQGLCPFHEDHHPSFAVHPEKQCFTCFACGEHGDVIEFLQKIEGCSFAEATSKINGKLKIENGKWNVGEVKKPAALKEPVVSTSKFSILNFQLSIERFLRALAPAASGDSALTPTWLDFEVGTSPAMVPDEWKAMRNRLVFPIRDEEGRLVGFAARRLTDDAKQAKYINSATSELYHKNEILYGMHKAGKAIRTKRFAIVVEGYKDVLAMHAAGYDNTVALCGTALCDGQIALLKRYTSRVVVMLDADEAGRKAAEKAIGLLVAQDIQAYGVELPEGDDPDSLFRRLGKGRFAAFLREKLAQVKPSEEAALLGRIHDEIQALVGITDVDRRLEGLRRLSVGMAHLTGLSLSKGRPDTMDWRWV